MLMRIAMQNQQVTVLRLKTRLQIMLMRIATQNLQVTVLQLRTRLQIMLMRIATQNLQVIMLQLRMLQVIMPQIKKHHRKTMPIKAKQKVIPTKIPVRLQTITMALQTVSLVKMMEKATSTPMIMVLLPSIAPKQMPISRVTPQHLML